MENKKFCHNCKKEVSVKVEAFVNNTISTRTETCKECKTIISFDSRKILKGEEV